LFLVGKNYPDRQDVKSEKSEAGFAEKITTAFKNFSRSNTNIDLTIILNPINIKSVGQ